MNGCPLFLMNNKTCSYANANCNPTCKCSLDNDNEEANQLMMLIPNAFL
jgi:hypothetical protein